MPEGVGYPPGAFGGGRPMLPIDYLRRIQSGGFNPSVGGGSAGPLAEILNASYGRGFGGDQRRVSAPPTGAAVSPAPVGGDPYLTNRFVRPGATPGEVQRLPNGSTITMPAEGLSQAEHDVLSGVTEGTPVAAGNEQILADLARRGVFTGGAVAPDGVNRLTFGPDGTMGSTLVAKLDPSRIRQPKPAFSGSAGGGWTNVVDRGGVGTSARLIYDQQQQGRAGGAPAGSNGVRFAQPGGAGNAFLSALRGRQAPGAAAGGGRAVSDPSRQAPESTIGAPKMPTPPRRAAPQPTPGDVVKGPRPVYRAPPLDAGATKMGVPRPGDDRRRRELMGSSARGTGRQTMPSRRAGQTDRLLGNRR